MPHYPIPPAHEITPVERVPFDIPPQSADEAPRKWARAELDALVAAAVAKAVASYAREAAEALHRHKMYGGH